MAIPTSIRQRGFSKWYERELLVGHAHLVLLLLATVAALGALEAYAQVGSERLLMVASVLVATVIGVWALRRYLFHLMRAELIANQATCPSCGTYARFLVESSESGGDGGGPEAMRVCCRRCQQRWRIEW